VRRRNNLANHFSASSFGSASIAGVAEIASVIGKTVHEGVLTNKGRQWAPKEVRFHHPTISCSALEEGFSGT
jgi:hypothetical protein